MAQVKRLPAALYVVDCRKERLAVTEANKLGIPIVAIVDTNCDPEQIQQVIPGNDDAIRAVRLITTMLSEAIVEGQRLLDERELREREEQAAAEARAAEEAARVAAEETAAAEQAGELAAAATGPLEAEQ